MSRLLLVEDDESNRLTLAMLLEDDAFDVETAASYGDAVRILTAAARPYDAVLLDQHLGDGLGSDIARLVRERMPGAATILISGSDAGETYGADIDARADKGTAFPQMVALIRRAIASRDSETGARG
jgi:DNA-binding response OmpR family regulator